MHKQVKGIISKVLVLVMAVTAVGVMSPEADAAKAKKPKLSKTKVTVTAGKKAKITVKNVKAKKVKKLTVKTAKKSIATVKKNSKTKFTITGKKEGTTTITASVKVGKKTTKLKVKVTVKKAKDDTKTVVPSASAQGSQAPSATTADNTKEGITLDQTAVTVNYYKTVKLNATVANSSETPVWTSSDTNVATVKDGVVTALGEDKSTAVITASISGASASCTVTVNKCEIGTTVVADNFDDGIAKYTTMRVTSTDPVVDIVDGGVSGKCFKVTGRTSTAQGALFDLTDICEPGSVYEFRAKAKVASNGTNELNERVSLILSSEIRAVEAGSESYDNLAVYTEKKGNFAGAADEYYNDPKEWNEFVFTFTAPDDMYHFGLYFETQSDTNCDIYVDEVSISLKERNATDYSIKGLKDAYAGIFDYVGCGASYDQFLGENASAFLASQYNSFTPGNCYKPDAILGSGFTQLTVDEAKSQGYYIPEDYESFADNQKSGKAVVPALDYTRVDQVLERAHELGVKMRAHTLVWHQQTPIYFFKQGYKVAKTATNAEAAAMDSRLNYFITNEMNHILAKDLELAGGDKSKCVVYAWDVVNEYLHSHKASDSSVNENGITFYEEIYGKAEDGTYLYDVNGGMSTSPSYVKKAFKFAYDALVANGREDIELVYNDYNTYDPNITDAMIELVNFINAQDDINVDGATLCEAVGMQAHLDYKSAFHSVEKFKTAVEKFVEAGFNIQITELDATGTKDDRSAESFAEQAAYYKDIVNVLIDNKENITSFTIWSLYDAVSWRANRYPCVFKGLYNVKPAYTALIEAAEEAKAK